MPIATVDGVYVYPPRWKHDIDRPPDVPHAADDEFTAAALDPKWTAVDGVLGAVGLFAGGGGTYDLTTRPGWLLMQGDSINQIQLRQDYTLPDGFSVILAMAVSLMADGQSNIDHGWIDIGLAINDDDTDWYVGNWVTVHLDPQPEGWRIWSGDNAAGRSTPAAAPNPLCSCPIALQLYFRIARVGLDYYTFWSVDGLTWFDFALWTLPGAADNIWIFTIPSAGAGVCGDPTPIQAFNWIRVVPNTIDP